MFALEIEEAKKTTENTPAQAPTPTTTSATTPDYAAGLSSTPAYAPMTPQPAAVLTGTLSPSFPSFFQIIC